jgi:diguanylate cyclase (GGDEF)-like protein
MLPLNSWSSGADSLGVRGGTAVRDRGFLARSVAPSGAVLGAVAFLSLLWLLRPDALSGLFLYEGTGALAAVTVVVGVVWRKPANRWPWLLLALAIVFDVSGDLVYDLTELVGHTPGYTSMLSNVLYLASYPVAIAAVIGFLGPRGRRRDATLLLDATVYATAAWLAIWVVVVHPALDSSGISFWDWVPTVLYPPLDVIVLVAVWRIGRGSIRRSGSWLLLAVAFAVMLLADVLFAILKMPDAGFWNATLSVAYLVSYGCIAAAAVHPHMAAVEADPEPRFHPVSQRARIAALALSVTTPLVLLAIWPREVAREPLVTALAGLLIVAGALSRGLAAVHRHRDAESTITWQATHDSLTGLWNRSQLVEQLDTTVRRAQRSGTHWALLFCDLDQFKVINDSLGHSTGDALLIAVAQRLRDEVRGDCHVARLGGDEFVVFWDQLPDSEMARSLATRLLAIFREPLAVADNQFHISASIGMVTDEQTRSSDPDTILRDGDLAMCAAKELGRGRVETFHPKMHQRVTDRLATESALRRALIDDELRLAYQPIFSLHDDSLVAHEALLRWDRGGSAFVKPDAFIPLAEDLGLIVDIGAWVLRHAAQYLASLRAQHSGAYVSVNISARELRHPEMAKHAGEIVLTENVDPGSIILEVTESALLEPTGTVRENLEQLHRAGFRFAIDDFGTGYSSLAHLRQLDVEMIKIDRLFVDGLDRDPDDATIVETIITMAHALGATVTAEGVERPEQLAILRGLGCDFAQGFLLGRPRVATRSATSDAASETEGTPIVLGGA